MINLCYTQYLESEEEAIARIQNSIITLVSDFVYSYDLNRDQCIELYDMILDALDEFYEKLCSENL